MPSKTFIASTWLRTELRRAPQLGFDIDIDDAKISLPQIHARVKQLATEQSADITAQLLSAGVHVVAGRGELIDPSPAWPATASRPPPARRHAPASYDADVVLIATGASPRMLPSAQPDGERILTWRQLYDLEALPEHLIVVGSGVTGAEFVHAYTELGVPVTVVASRDRVLPYEDADAAAGPGGGRSPSAASSWSRTPARESVTRTDDGVLVTLADGRTVEGSHALMTIGSVPNTSGLGLDRVGIELGRGDYLTVDRVRGPRCPASTPPATAPGLLLLASVAAMQGRIAMYHALGEGVSPIRLRTVAATVFTRPEIAAVGVPQSDDRRRFGAGPDHHAAAADQRAGQDVGAAAGFRQALLPAGHRRGDRRRGGGADRLGADPADRRGRAEPDHRQRVGADAGRLPVVVRLDHRGRAAADGARRSGLTAARR